jgi:putative copper export protein
LIVAADTAIRALHLIAAAVWAGGLVFLALAVGVARKTVSERERVALFRGLGRRFAVVGGIALVVLIATGTDMASDRIAAWDNLTDTDYGKTLTEKLVLVALVIALTLFHSLVQGPALSHLREQADEHPDDADLQAKIRRKAAIGGVVRIATLLGTLVILVLAAKLVTG